MQRTDWTFQYRASQIAEATRSKIDYHQERLTFWKAKREEVLATIRAEGIEVDEKIVLAFQNPEDPLPLDIQDWLHFFGRH